MSSESINWHKDYFQKCLSGLIEEKNKVDACVNWVLTLNAAIMSVAFLSGQARLSLFLAELGIVFTWMIMMRSCRAYRQLVNFGFIVKRLHDYERCPSDRSREKRLINAIRFLDYPEEGTDSVYLTSRRQVFRMNLGHEYGVIMLVYIALALHAFAEDTSLLNGLSLLVLVAVLSVTFFTMFYKKEGSPQSVLRLTGERLQVQSSIGLGDLYDRLSILKLKKEKLDLEVDEYMNEITECIRQYESMGVQVPSSKVSEIEAVNAEIWKLESQMRNGGDSPMDLGKVGHVALAVRDLNAQRVSIRNQINRDTGTGYEEPY